MNRIVIIYKSKYGSTKQYAQWTAQTLNCDIFEQQKFTPQMFKNYDIIIYGGGLYAGGINGISLITKNLELLKNKKIIVFTCGLADPKNATNIKNINNNIDKAFDVQVKSKIKFFHLRGGIDYSKLSIVHKSMMAMLKHVLLKKDKNSLTREDKELLETYGKSVDFTDKSTIQPIISYIKNL